jgi:hypothetical protein
VLCSASGKASRSALSRIRKSVRAHLRTAGPGVTIRLFKIEHGFVGVDVTLGTRLYRVVNTHLEVRTPDPTHPLSAAIQAAQATELIATVQATTPAGRALIVLGDLNSSPDDAPFDQILPPYFQFISAHFFDAWLLRPGNAPGFTCCQAEDLENHRSELPERVDMIFTNFLPRKVKARLVGTRVAEKTRPDRLWPSDHAGVVAEITIDYIAPPPLAGHSRRRDEGEGRGTSTHDRTARGSLPLADVPD